MPVFSYVFDDASDFIHRKTFHGLSCADSLHDVFQSRGPRLSFQFTDQLEFFAQRQSFDDRRNIEWYGDIHKVSITDKSAVGNEGPNVH